VEKKKKGQVDWGSDQPAKQNRAAKTTISRIKKGRWGGKSASEGAVPSKRASTEGDWLKGGFEMKREKSLSLWNKGGGFENLVALSPSIRVNIGGGENLRRMNEWGSRPVPRARIAGGGQ